MIQWFFLDWVNAEAGAAPVSGEYYDIADPATHEAGAALTIAQLAVARAQVALDASIIKQVPVPGRILFGNADRCVHVRAPYGKLRRFFTPFLIVPMLRVGTRF
jgi:hypothetical protein